MCTRMLDEYGLLVFRGSFLQARHLERSTGEPEDYKLCLRSDPFCSKDVVSFVNYCIFHENSNVICLHKTELVKRRKCIDK